MIIKGGARGKPHELSAHLLRADTNEKVRLFNLEGVVAHDLKGALAEMAAIASGSRCTKPLYHVSISPGATTVLTDEQWAEAILRLEKALGLEGHQRAAVIHTKKDRQHAHIVWNRVDVETLKAAHHSHNFRTHEEVARSLERDFGLEHVQGVHVDRDGQRPERRPTTRESQQEARTGWLRDDAVRDITDAWQLSQDGAGFAAQLAERGYCLARGDKKPVIVLDPTGGVHDIARRIKGVRAADVRKHLADLDLTALPSIEAARAALMQRRDRRAERAKQPTPQVEMPAAPAQRPRLRLSGPARYTTMNDAHPRLTIRTPPALHRPAALTPRPTPPSWARSANPEPPKRAAAPSPRPSLPPPPMPPKNAQHDAQRAALRQRQNQAATAEISNLVRFHSAQLGELDQYHEGRLVEVVADVERDIARHNGLLARVTNIAAKGEYHRQLAYLVAKREGVWQREAARQNRVRAELKAAQEKERFEAEQRRATRERLEREALERRLADPSASRGRDQKERPGLEGPGA